MAVRTHRNERDPAMIVARRRTELQMTQAQLAKALKYGNVNFISMLEKGKSLIPLEKAIDVADALEMDRKWFIEMVMRQRIPSVAEELFGKDKASNVFWADQRAAAEAA